MTGAVKVLPRVCLPVTWTKWIIKAIKSWILYVVGQVAEFTCSVALFRKIYKLVLADVPTTISSNRGSWCNWINRLTSLIDCSVLPLLKPSLGNNGLGGLSEGVMPYSPSRGSPFLVPPYETVCLAVLRWRLGWVEFMVFIRYTSPAERQTSFL